MRRLSGPNAALAAARLGLSAASAGGDPDAIQDAVFRLKQAQDRLDRARQRLTPPSFTSRLQSAISSSRIGAGPQGLQLFPLINRLIPLFGRFTGPLALATSGLTGLAQAARQSAQTLGATSGAGMITGGGARNAAFLRAIGITPGEQPGFAGGLRERVARDPLAMSAASRLGIQGVLPRDWDPGMDEGRLAEQIVRRLARVPDARERLSLARRLGVEERLPQIEALRRSPGLLREMERHAKIMGDPDTVRGAQRFNDEMERLRLQRESFGTRAIQPWQMAFGALAGKAADAGENQDFLGQLSDAFFEAFTGARIKRAAQTPQQAQAAALQANTAALQANTGALLKPGSYGGTAGGRMLPRATSADSQAALQRGILKLGYFGE